MQATVPWIRKYAPKTLAEVQGHDRAIAGLKAYLTGYRSQKKRAALLYGPTGSGKTCAVHAISRDLGLELLEVNASDVRNEAAIRERVGTALSQRSLFFRGKLILLDEIDGLSGTKDRGGLAAVTKLIRTSAHPIILTANEIWDSKFSSLRSTCELIEFRTLTYQSVAKVLSRIALAEGVEADDAAIVALARSSGGDVRAAINDLQTVSSETRRFSAGDLALLGGRRQTEPIAQAIMRILKTTDEAVARAALDSTDEDLDEVLLWLDENLPREYGRPEDLAAAYDALSRADVYRGRIRRQQHWRFLVYIRELLTVGVALAKKEKYKGFPSYRRPMRPLKIWQANQRYLRRRSIAEKIAAGTHSSTRRVIQDMVPYLAAVCRQDAVAAVAIAEEYGLDSEEIAWLRERR
ncbi:replication factor C large subunit [Candidatus Woesearchaeota archaeon]|nr:replication factor C large subunit [Candidatus Woesearchaeota archaeon]